MQQTILVGIIHHPIEHGSATIVEVPYRNQTLFQLKEQFALGQDVIIGLDGKQCDDWDILVPPASKVVILPAAAGGLFAAIGSYIFSWAFVATIVISIALSYLGGVLFGPDMKQPKGVGQEREEGQSFGWNPITTQQEGIPHPMCYGINMHYGNVVARWTDVDESGDEILYMILDYGRGPVQGRGANIVYFDDQPSGNFPSVSIQERLGTLNQTCMTGFEKNKLEYRPAWTITYDDGPVTWTTPNNFFDDLEYTLEFPGLYHFNNDGSRSEHGVGVKVQISERDLSAWTTLMDTTINGNQLSPVYKAYRANEQVADIVVHGKQYDLKITKTSEDKSVDRYGDKLILRAVREVVDVAFTRPGKALLGVTALATERLSDHINVKWVADDKLVRVYNGTSWGVAFSRNRAWIALDMLTQPVISGDGDENPWVIERYEGLDPSQIDLALFYEWAEWCDDDVPSGVGEETEDRMPCDIIVDWQTDVWTLAYEIAQVGRMYPYWQGNILTGWVDKVVTDEPVDLITFDNVMVRSWRNAWAGYGEISGSVEVFYKDALLGYERKGLPLSNESAGKYTRIVSVEGTGVTGRALAIRVGNHMLERNKLIKNFNSCRMYKDALRHRLGDLVRLQSNVPNWGKAYRVVKSEADNTVELDRTCDAEAGEIIYVRSYDETNKRVDIGSYTVASVLGKVVTITETWDVSPIKNNSVAIGVAGKIKLRRVIKMRHTADNYFDVEFETYDATLFDSDNVSPVIDNPDYEWPQPAPDLGKPTTKWEVVDLISQMMRPSPDIEIPWISNCDWTGNEVDTITWAKRNADEPILFRYRGVTYNITPDNTTDEFVYWDPNYTTVFRTTDSRVAMVAALVAGGWLVCTNKDGVPSPATPVQTLHGGLIQAGTIIAAQIIVSGINALALQNAPAEAGADVTGAHPDDVIYYAPDSSPPSHLAGRLWYDTTAGKLKRSSGEAWNIIGDETSAHQGDISLANLAEKSVDSLVDGTTYKKFLNTERTKLTGVETGADVTGAHQGDISLANLSEKSIDSLIDSATHAKMLQAWKRTGDLTKIDGGQISAQTIESAQLTTGELITLTAQIKDAIIDSAKIGLLEVKTANIDNLSVGNPKIEDESVAISAYTVDGVSVALTSKGGGISATSTAVWKHSGAVLDLLTYHLSIGGIEFGHGSFASNIDEYMYSISLAGVAVPGVGAQTIQMIWAGDNWALQPGCCAYGFEHRGK